MKYDCLIVDDEIAIAQSTSEYLNMFEVQAAYVTGYAECLEFLEGNEISLLLLDINLGADSGFALCKKLRETMDIPILFLSARTSDDDILTALGLGGDDYIKKPFTLSILLAKVRAVLRRSAGSAERGGRELQIGGIVIDYPSRSVCVNGSAVKLKELEYRLLCYLAENRNRVISKDELFSHVWKGSFAGDGTLAVHIRHLREKLEQDPQNPRVIKTIWGTGYLFEAGL